MVALKDKQMRNFIALTAVSLFTSGVSAHHSNTGTDNDSIVTIQGTVTEFSLRNPHAYVTVETTDESGEPIEWEVQLRAATALMRLGWRRDSLSPGDRVIVGLHPARDGRPYGLMDSIETEAGTPIPMPVDAATAGTGSASPGLTSRTYPVEGRWIADRSSIADYVGLQELMDAELTLTESGMAARAAYSENSSENPELTCDPRPSPTDILYTGTYPLDIRFDQDAEIITIRSQYFDSERTVYMDGRGHPDNDERFHLGHSIGRWEGTTLVVDTTNFADNRSPYQNGVPSGAQKHVVERYRPMGEDGARVELQFILEDPEYIIGSMTHSRELVYSPQRDMSPFNCDPEATRRFLP